ncbi:MAG: DNA-directed RNA polymerase subunit omega [Actinobacteria bacterium]|jgi:DNA-directed RNA polymerase subunit omega|nr:DNA-directed RNA polymerase subunit omega [Actinomycetota bacterium]MCL6105159.1 DNA-directed RNA polymerase subunit omega [Actinomycetota bacterium]
MQERNSMIEPPIETLLEKTGSKFSLVILAAQRGRQINDYFSKLGQGMGDVLPPQVTSASHTALSMAFEEIAQGKLEFEGTVNTVDTKTKDK